MAKEFSNHVILGAGGAIARALIPELIERRQKIIAVSRSGRLIDGADPVAADLLDPKAVSAAVPEGSAVYLLAGLPYQIDVWREQWPAVMENTIQACREKQALLVFFDNVYMYGFVDGVMTEDTPHKPSSKKGEVRARIADMLTNEFSAGRLNGLIARSADFYGPGAGSNGIPNVLIIRRIMAGKSAQWLGSADRLHSLTYTTDCGRALPLLVGDEGAHNRVWHLPTASPPVTIRGFAEITARLLGGSAKVATLSPFTLRLAGLFDKTLRELPEMMYQNLHDYVFDSTRFQEHFSFAPTTYEKGIAETIRFHQEAEPPIGN